MFIPRRFSLQLTPLFDLMLIVIFAQYLSVRSSQVEQAQSAEQLKSEAQEAQSKLAQAETALEQSQAHEEVLGRMLQQLFQIPQGDVEKAISLAGQRSPEEQAELEQEFQQIARASSAASIEHILTYEEIRKRCDLWNLHLGGDGVMTLQTNSAEAAPILDVSSTGLSLDRLSAELFSRYKEVPEQKSLVLILLTYDRGTRIQLTRQLREILPQITKRMQEDAGGRSRYDFADMGFRGN